MLEYQPTQIGLVMQCHWNEKNVLGRNPKFNKIRFLNAQGISWHYKDIWNIAERLCHHDCCKTINVRCIIYQACLDDICMFGNPIQ